jgi:hypothetical protein
MDDTGRGGQQNEGLAIIRSGDEKKGSLIYPVLGNFWNLELFSGIISCPVSVFRKENMHFPLIKNLGRDALSG